jgi:hypothetical protein
LNGFKRSEISNAARKQKEKEPAVMALAGFPHVFAQELVEPVCNPASSFQTASSCC